MVRFITFLSGVLLAAVVTDCDSARILGLFHYHGRSHFIMFEALMKGLASKGHDVTVVSHFPQNNPRANYKDLSLKGSLPGLVNNFTLEMARDFGFINLMDFMWNQNIDFCRTVLGHPVMQNLIQSKEHFDLIITEIYAVDCCYGFAHKFNTPIIGMISSVSYPWANVRIANPDNPSYIPNYFLSFRSQMTFIERLVNSLLRVFTGWGEYIFGNLRTDKLLREHFGQNMPPLSDLTRRTSLIFVNSHFSINQPRPTVPAFVEVGGLHIPAPQKLPQDLETFLNEAEHGVIYFSFGSLVRGETLPRDKLNAFIETFKKIPQRVLWKADGEAIPDLPPNVKASSWLPQLDILNHPNVRVFISHGGLMGTQEAVYTGVPVLGIPLFADQNQNIKSLQHSGMAVALDFDNITEETFSKALNDILSDPSYGQKAKHLSLLFRDRPQSPLDTAIYWTEYVIRHGGATHLCSAAVDMPLYQYLLLDVIAVLLLAAVAILSVVTFIIRKIITCITSTGGKTRKTEKKLKNS